MRAYSGTGQRVHGFGLTRVDSSVLKDWKRDPRLDQSLFSLQFESKKIRNGAAGVWRPLPSAAAAVIAGTGGANPENPT